MTATLCTLEDLEEFCDAVGVTTVLHPTLRRAIHAVEREFCAGASAYLWGTADETFLLPLAGGGHAALTFSRRLSASGSGIFRVEIDQPGLDQVRRSLRAAAFPARSGRGGDPARSR